MRTTPTQPTPPLSRRTLLGAGVGLLAAVSGCTAPRADLAIGSALVRTAADPRRRILLKDGVVLTMDGSIPDLERGDVLIAGGRIEAVGANLNATADVIVDARGQIVMPGFIDTHHHQYETALRSILADGALGLQPEDGPENYFKVIQQLYTPLYSPEDAYISQLVASLSQLSAGVTTTVDTSQVSLSPEHTDACISALRDSGRRAVYAYSPGSNLPTSRYPGDIRRLRRDYFASEDQLLTLAMNSAPDAKIWALAREVGAPIVSHIVGKRFGDLDQVSASMGPDNEYIHCTQLSEATWKRIADTGGKISIAPAIEMQMRHGMPPLQKALDLGLRPSLSVDVETNMTADMFSIMRTAFTLQRGLAGERSLSGDANAPQLATSRQVLEWATTNGAYVTHLERRIGTITPGKEADILLLDAGAINTIPLNNAPGAVVTLMDTSNVSGVFVAGVVKKWKGQLVGVDLPGLRSRIEKSRSGLIERARRQPNLFGSCCK